MELIGKKVSVYATWEKKQEDLEYGGVLLGFEPQTFTIMQDDGNVLFATASHCKIHLTDEESL